MTRSIFAVFAALALVFAAPAVAQDTQEPEHHETRTNPDADSITGESGLTITGTVVEWNDEQIELDTATGIEHIQIVPRTQWDENLTVGEEVSVDYTRTSQGVMIASKIRTGGAVARTGQVDTTTTTTRLDTDTRTDLDTTADVEMEAETDVNTDWNERELDTDVDTTADFDADVDVDRDADVRADLDTDVDVDRRTRLPATGSELPLLGLLGLLSLVGALGLRSFLR